MAYSGTSIEIPVKGGWNANYNVDSIPSSSLADSTNINIHNGGYEPRGGTILYNSTPVTNNPKILGAYQYLVGSTNEVVAYTGVGGTSKDILYTIDSDGVDKTLWTAITGVSATPSMCLYNYRLLCANGYDSIQVYAGSTDELSSGTTTTSLVRSANITTATFSSAHGLQTGAYIQITGATPTTFNVDKVQITRTGTNTFTYPNSGTSESATVQGTSKYYISIANQSVDIITPSSDWGSGDQPIQLIKHGSGNSERLWAIGTLGTPGFVYYSTDNDGSSLPDFASTGSGRIYIDTGDKFGLVGGCEYQDRLIVFGKKTSYIINDSDSDTSNWGYSQSGWLGGAAHHRLIVVTPNDVFCMTEDGEIYSVTAVQSYGDYKSASITRPAGIDSWIRDNVDLTYISSFHAIYDYEMKAIKWFMVRTGKTQVDTALVYYIERKPDEAWTIHQNTTSNINGYNAACSFHYREATNKIKVYTGDFGGASKGNIWKTEQTTYSDNNTAYEAKLRTPRLSLGQDLSAVRFNKKFKELRITDQNFLNTTAFLVKFYIDGVMIQDTYAFDEPAHGFLLGTSILGIGALSGDNTEYMEYIVPIGDVGKRLEIEVSNNNRANVYFYISSMILDYKQLTMRP